MALHLQLRPKPLSPLCFARRFSSSLPPPPPPPPDPDVEGEPSASPSAAPPHFPSYSSYFSDVKERLKAPLSPPRRIPSDPPPPSSLPSPKDGPASLEDICKRLAKFDHRSGGSIAPSPFGNRPPSSPTISFQELYKNNVLAKASSEGVTEKAESPSLEFIRQSLSQFRPSPKDKLSGRRRDSFSSPFSLKPFQESMGIQMGEGAKGPSNLLSQNLPESIFGKEMREKEAGEGATKKVLQTEFLKMYTYDELGEKLSKLRPGNAAKGDDKDWFSLTELNERLAKLREMENRETESRMGAVAFKELREGLMILKDADTKKKDNMQRLSIIGSLTGIATPTFMLKPPQEELLERYFHPDHMSSAEKMNLELKRVRDEFKMSESDCGSTRVQVAQLTTKIKHLNAVLHKKDKHSRKGLLEMVQRRKKLLKYLRRTDWDSYCLVLSKLGLRDVPEYKKLKYKS